MKHLKTLLAVLLVLAMALPVLCACDSGSNTSETQSQSGSTGNTSTGNTGDESVNTDVPPAIESLGGREINILCWDWSAGSNSIKGYTGEVISNAEGEPSRVDIAKKAVIDAVEADYDVSIGGKVTNSSSFLNDVNNMVTTGTYEYDMIFASAHYAQNMLANNLLADLNSVPTLKLTNSWWDQNAVEDLSIGGRLFWVCGDINTYDNLGTWCVLFNKELKNTLGIGDDFYQMAKDCTWTLDYFMELCKGLTQEYDGNTGIDERDLWACGTEKFNVFAHIIGAGIHVVEKDDADKPYFTIKTETERTYSALDKIISFYNSADVMVADGGKFDNKGYKNVWEATVHKAFIEGRELFYVCGLINVAGFRDMKDPFGILPMPKTFAEQDAYYHTVSPGNSSYLMIPRGLPEIEELGLVIEALAMKSQELVTPEFYEMQLKGRDARDDESEDMLDLIFASRSFDMGPIFSWGDIMECYWVLDTNYASRFDQKVDGAEIAMEEFIEKLEENALAEEEG